MALVIVILRLRVKVTFRLSVRGRDRVGGRVTSIVNQTMSNNSGNSNNNTIDESRCDSEA